MCFQVVFPGIIVYAEANVLQLLFRLTVISETMQVDLNTCFIQRFDLVIHVYHAPVIGRVRDVEGYDMEVQFHQLALKSANNSISVFSSFSQHRSSAARTRFCL